MEGQQPGTREAQEGFFLLVLSACISMAADGKGSKGVALLIQACL